MTLRSCPAAAAMVLMLASGSIVLAQATDQPEEGGGAARSQSALDAMVDLFGAIDKPFGSTPPARPVPVAVPLAPVAAAVPDTSRRDFWGLNSTLSYEKTTQRAAFRATAGASVRRFTAVSDSLQPGYTGTIYGSGPLSRRFRWETNESLTYGPNNATAFFAPGAQSGQADGFMQTLPTVDYGLSAESQLLLDTRGTLSYAISRRGTLSFSAGYQWAGTLREAPLQPPGQPGPGAPLPVEPIIGNAAAGGFRRWDVGGRYSHTMTRYMSWYGGYNTTMNAARQDAASFQSPRLDGLDAGLSYNRPLSFSRRTRVSAEFGATMFQDRQGGTREWRAVGNAGLRHELGRTWIAQVGYERNTWFVPTFIDPVLSDAITGRLGGNLSERSMLNVLVNYSTGTVGASTGTNGYHMASTSANYRYAFLRQVAVYAEYFLFDFDFESGVPLGDAIYSSSKRHGVRFGLSFGTGLLGNRRRNPLTMGGENAQ